MSGRKLLLDTIQKKRTDRVPVSPFIYNNVVNEKNNGEPADPVAACAQLYRKYGFDIILRNYTFGDAWDEDRLSCDTWRVKKEATGDIGNIWNEQTTITTPERTLTQVRSFRKVTPNIVVSATGRYFIQGPDDFEQFVKYQPPIGKPDLSVIAHAKEVVADDGIACTWIQGAFNYVERYRGLQELLTDPYDDEGFYDEMMEYFGARNFEMTRQLIAAGSDLICIEANMATGTMAGPRMFGDYIMEREEQLIDLIHSEGCYAMYHNCGDGKSLLPLIDQMSMDIYESLTPPPFGDTVLTEALDTIKPPKVLLGNLDQIDFLVHATPDEVRRRTREILESAKERGHFILATSDYISEGTPEENLYAFAQAAHEFGRY